MLLICLLAPPYPPVEGADVKSIVKLVAAVAWNVFVNRFTIPVSCPTPVLTVFGYFVFSVLMNPESGAFCKYNCPLGVNVIPFPDVPIGLSVAELPP